MTTAFAPKRRSSPGRKAGPVACLLLAAIAVTTGHADDAGQAAATVQAFNAAISARNLDELLAQFAPGGVQFTLRPSHRGLASEGLTRELIPQWQMVGPVLFSATRSYARQAEILESRAMGDLATVWARIETRSVPLQGEPRSESFTEVYLLVRDGQGWKIAGVADNRQPDNIGVDGGGQ